MTTRRSRRSPVRKAHRDYLVPRAALLLATRPDVIEVEVEGRFVQVKDREDRAVRVRADLTVLMRSGTRIAMIVAPRQSLATLIDWPAKAIFTTIAARTPSWIVALSPRWINEGFAGVARGADVVVPPDLPTRPVASRSVVTTFRPKSHDGRANDDGESGSRSR